MVRVNWRSLAAGSIALAVLVTGAGSALAATVSWKDPVNGNWADGSKWSTGAVPGAGDDVVIDVSGGSFTVTLNALALVRGVILGRVDGAAQQTLAIVGGGTLLPTAPSDVRATGRLLLAGGTLSGAESIDVTGVFEWTFGTVTGAGPIDVSGTLTVAVPQFTGGIGTRSAVLDGRTLTNGGNGSLFISPRVTGIGASEFVLRNNAILENTGTLQLLSDEPLKRGDSTSPQLKNSGVLRKLLGSGAATIDVHVVNNGILEPMSGTLALARSSTLGGTIGGTTTLLFPTGLHLLDGLVVGGTGTTRIDGATVNTVGSGAVVAASGTLHLASGTLGGAGPLSVSGSLRWDYGTISGSGPITVSGTLTIAVPQFSGGIGTRSAVLEGRTLTNAGNASLFISPRVTGISASEFVLRNNAVLENAGTLDLVSDEPVRRGDSSDPQVRNSGVLAKIAGGGTATFEVAVSNSGTISAEIGTLSFNGDFHQSGGTTALKGGSIASNGTLNFSGGEITGNGLINANVISGAELIPGLSPGSLSITKGLTQSAGSTTRIELGGVNPGTGFDQIQLTGTGFTAALTGGLIVDLFGGFVPSPGQSFIILTAPNGAVTGNFGSIQFPDVPGVAFQVVVGPKTVILQALAGAPTPTATHSSSATPTLAASSTPTTTATSTPTTSATATNSATATTTSTPTQTTTLTSTRTPTKTATATMSATATRTATRTSTATHSAPPSISPTPTASGTPTASPTSTGTVTATTTATATATFVPTRTATPLPSTTATPTATTTATPTAVPTASVTPTPNPTVMLTPSVTATPSGTPTATASPTATGTPVPSATVTASPTPSPSTLPPPPCPADCNSSGETTIDELIAAVRIALGLASIDECRAADTNGDGAIAIDDIVRAVGAALGGCRSHEGTLLSGASGGVRTV